MATSLNQLVSNLDKSRFNSVRKYHPEDRISLLLRKGVHPYDYMDSPKRLKEPRLPSEEAFYSRLNDEHISDEDYAHAQKVWKEFKMKTLEDYHNLYNELDVLLSADVFENFSEVCCKHYNLDPAHCYTAPGLAWDAALKVTNVELELFSIPDMLLMVEQGIRGGVSMISTRYGKANNKYMDDEYDACKPSKYITYLDANNLYRWAMSKPLLAHGCEWMKPKVIEIWEKNPLYLRG